MGTFLQFLEIQQSDIEHAVLQDRMDSAEDTDFSERPFNHIFGDKLRLVIPLKKEQGSTEYALEKALEGKGYEVDLKKGIAYSTVKTDKVSQKRGQKIGKLLNKLIKYSQRSEDDQSKQWENLLHWWEMNRKTIGSVDKKGLSIIISRSPIDIFRMSDFPGWSSCHAPPGKRGHMSEFWPCAGQEARTGGGIAYVVDNEDLEGVDLQDAEVFDDPDRRDTNTMPSRRDTTQGIIPLERLRLRRFTVELEDGEEDILIPESGTYGSKHTGFQDAVVNWAKHAQRNVVDFDNPPDFKSAKLRGGSYQNTDADDIWNQLFDTHVSGKKTTEDENEEGTRGPMSADRLQELAEEAIKAHELKHIHIDAEVDEGDGEVYMWSRANISFSFPDRYFIKVPEEDDFETSWGRDKDKEDKTLGEEIKDEIDIPIEEIGINHYNDMVHIWADITHEVDARYGPLEELEHFLDQLDDYDNDYDKHMAVLRNILQARGFLKDWTTTSNWKFKHFEVDIEEMKTGDSSDATSKIYIGELDGIDVSKIKIGYGGELEVHGSKEIFPKFVTDDNLTFVAQVKNYVASAKGYPAGKTRNNIPDEGVIEQPIPVIMTIRFPLPSDMVGLSRTNARLRHLDNYWEYYYRRAVQWWEAWKKKLILQSSGQGGGSPLPLERPRYATRPQRPRPMIQGTFPWAAEPEGEFKDWFTSQETTDGFLSGLRLDRPKHE